MKCPQCNGDAAEGDWVCAFCDCILDPSVLADLGGEEPEADVGQDSVDPPDAVILRDIDGSQDISAVLGPGAQADGSTKNYLFYSATQQRLLPAAVPRQLKPLAPPFTPYEGFVFELIDGQRRVLDIQGMVTLSAEELSVTLLTLFDRGLIAIDGVAPRSSPHPPSPVAAPTVEAPRPSFLSPTSPAEPAVSDPPAAPAERAQPLIDFEIEEGEATSAPDPSEPSPEDSTSPGPAEPPTSGRPGSVTAQDPTSPEAAPQGAPSAEPTPQDPAEAPASERSGSVADPPAAAGVDPLLARKALKLYEQALDDLHNGNALSARMNMKIALSFDPSNQTIERAFQDLVATGNAPPRPTEHRSRARELYDRASEAEALGKEGEAIRLLEAAIKISRRAPFLNRLGVLLATKRRRYQEAHRLISEAIELAPSNTTYQHNLRQVLTMAASDTGEPKKRRRGLLGFFRR